MRRCEVAAPAMTYDRPVTSPGPPFVNIEKTYGRRGPMQQYRPRTNISFRCMRCGRAKTAKLVCLYEESGTAHL